MNPKVDSLHFLSKFILIVTYCNCFPIFFMFDSNHCLYSKMYCKSPSNMLFSLFFIFSVFYVWLKLWSWIGLISAVWRPSIILLFYWRSHKVHGYYLLPCLSEVVPWWFFGITMSRVCSRAVLVNLTVHHYTLFPVSPVFGLGLFLDPLIFLFVIKRTGFSFCYFCQD